MFELENEESIQLAIKEEKINESPIPNAVSISITNAFPVNKSNNPNLDFLNIPTNGMVSTVTSYFFINKNGLTEAYFDENGWDYVSAYNHEALLWSNNFLCNQKTSVFVDNIINVLKKVAPEMPSPVLGLQVVVLLVDVFLKLKD